MTKTKSILFSYGFTLLELVITMVLITVLVLSMGTILAHTQTATNKQYIIEHVNNYGHEALKIISEEIRRANQVNISTMLGMSRIRLSLPDDSDQPGHANKITISASPENGMMVGREPLLTIRNKRNAFLFEDNNNIDFEISNFNCELVPSSTGLSGKLSRYFYDLALQIDIITINAFGDETVTPYRFHRQVFAVSAYL
jgi:prepilin-type N-terminal cleavage/methylation domain-containing protein